MVMGTLEGAAMMFPFPGVGARASFELSHGLDMRLGAGIHLTVDWDPPTPIEWSGELPEQTLRPFAAVSTTSHLGWSFPVSGGAVIGAVVSVDTVWFVERGARSVGNERGRQR